MTCKIYWITTAHFDISSCRTVTVAVLSWELNIQRSWQPAWDCPYLAYCSAPHMAALCSCDTPIDVHWSDLFVGCAIAQASHRGYQGSNPDEFVWNMLWTKWHWSSVLRVVSRHSCHRPLQSHLVSSGASNATQVLADVPSGLSLIPHQETERKKLEHFVIIAARASEPTKLLFTWNWSQFRVHSSYDVAR